MKFIDLFSGIGGFRLGMEKHGHECVAFCEWNKFARQSYKAIHDIKGEDEWHDITQVSDEYIRGFVRDRGPIDCICGGFPCQSFSIAGKRGGFNDTRGTLFFEIMRLADIIRPRYLFLENVKGLLFHEGGATFETMLNAMDELGYDAEWEVLNSKNFGVPQNRERVFIIGHLRGSGRLPIFPIERANRQTDKTVEVIAHRKGYRRNTQVFDPNGITETLDTAQGGGRGHYTAIPVQSPDYKEKRQNGRRFKEDGDPMFTLSTQERHGIMLTVDEITRPTDISHSLMARDYKGLSNQEMAGVIEGDLNHENLGGLYLHESDAFRTPPIKDVSRTLKAEKNDAGVTDGVRIRRLTPLECWRLQGFKDEYFHKAKAAGVSNSRLYQQAGNSVTVNVIEEIAEKMTQRYKEETK